MNGVASSERGQQVVAAQVADRLRGQDTPQRARQAESGLEAAVPQAAVVELGRSSSEAATYAPPVARAESTIVLENGTALKLSAKSGQSEVDGGPQRVSEGAPSELNSHANTTVAGGAIVVMDAAKVRASVQVDIVVAASPGAPAGAPPVAPVLVAKVGTFSSLDAFAAVQPMQPQALRQADRHDDTEESANDEPQTERSEDPRWRIYKNTLDSVRSR